MISHPRSFKCWILAEFRAVARTLEPGGEKFLCESIADADFVATWDENDCFRGVEVISDMWLLV